MGQQESKEKKLYQHAKSGNIQGIKALRSDGAGLEWIDKQGRTPLIAACMELHRYNVAKTLIELGADVNAYRPGQDNGTPLHHAARRGLLHTVKLLLSHGANALIMNDYDVTPLDVARAWGHTNVVKAIEDHVCLFSGLLRELYGPGFLEYLVPQWLSRKVWVVILPCGSSKLQEPNFKLKLAIYSAAEDAQPRMIVHLWKANLEEPDFSQPNPVAIISNISRSDRIKLAPAYGDEKQQLQRFCNACKGIPQVMHPHFPFNNLAPSAPTVALPAASEEGYLAMAINASLHQSPANTVNSCSHENEKISYASEASSSHTYISKCEVDELADPETPVANTDDGRIQYPSIDTSTSRQGNGGEDGEDTSSSSCKICLDAPVEGACVPCGHMAGCMSCMNEIKANEWGCPVCRTKIDRVIRIYAV